MTGNICRLIALTALAFLLFSAGCISEPAVETTEIETPEDMKLALDSLSYDVSAIGNTILKEMSAVSEKMREAENTDEIKLILSGYYELNPGFTAVVFRDILHNEYTSVPVLLDIDLSKYSKNITEEDFKKAGGFIARDNVFTKYHGYSNIYYEPVYTKDGKYHGYLAFVTDFYSLLHLGDELETDRLYGDCACFITDKNDQILYSSSQETVGEYLPTGRGFFDSSIYIPYVDTEEGACKYTSRCFNVYDGSTETEKITAWRQIKAPDGSKRTIYLVKEFGGREYEKVNFTDKAGTVSVLEKVTAMKTEHSMNEIRDAYNYASENGTEKCIERINGGEYDSALFLIDMDGNVLAASKGKPGKNFLNNRGVYVNSYMRAAVQKAELGGGFIYYSVPVERTVFPSSAVFTFGAVMPLDETCFLYSTFPGMTHAATLNYDLCPDITTMSRILVKEVSKSGIDSLIYDVNKYGKDSAKIFAPNLTTKIDDIVVLDFDGNVYASVLHPELVGKSATGIIDAYGGSATRLSTTLAKTGSGFMTYLKANAEKEGYVDLYFTMVQPVDDDYYIYVSVFIGTFKDPLTPVLDNLELAG